WVRVAVLVDEIAVIPVDVDADLIARHMSESVDGQPGTTVDGEFAAERRSHRHRDGSGLLVFVSDLRAAAGWRFLALRRGGLSGVVAEVPVESLRGDFDRHRIGQQGHVDVADFGVGPEGGRLADDGPILRPGVDCRCRDVEALELGFRDPGWWCRPSRGSATPTYSVAGAGIAHAEVADFFITAFGQFGSSSAGAFTSRTSSAGASAPATTGTTVVRAAASAGAASWRWRGGRGFDCFAPTSVTDTAPGHRKCW